LAGPGATDTLFRTDGMNQLTQILRPQGQLKPLIGTAASNAYVRAGNGVRLQLLDSLWFSLTRQGKRGQATT
ncbi:MAG: hypothetical protein RJB60_2920, partial [Pseudomonadota bacterium]